MKEQKETKWTIEPPVLQTTGDTPYWTDKEFTHFQLFSFARYVEMHRGTNQFISYQEIFEKWDKRGRTDY